MKQICQVYPCLGGRLEVTFTDAGDGFYEVRQEFSKGVYLRPSITLAFGRMLPTKRAEVLEDLRSKIEAYLESCGRNVVIFEIGRLNTLDAYKRQDKYGRYIVTGNAGRFELKMASNQPIPLKTYVSRFNDAFRYCRQLIEDASRSV